MPLKVQKHYAKYVTTGGDGPSVLKGRAADLGYTKKKKATTTTTEEQQATISDDGGGGIVPSELYDPILFRASCGSGCPLRLPGGQPTKEDRIVMDLGCGAGHDVLLLASSLLLKKATDNNAKAKVIGVDVTTEMIDAAKENVQRLDANMTDDDLATMIEFMEMDFENPTNDFVSRYENQIDLIVSNGVFNLCQNKSKTFETIYELLRPQTGRLVFSDVMKLETSDVNPDAKIATSINGDVFSS